MKLRDNLNLVVLSMSPSPSASASLGISGFTADKASGSTADLLTEKPWKWGQALWVILIYPEL